MITEEEKQEIRAGSYEYGFEEGMQEGMQQGMKQGLETVAKTMLARNMPVGEITSLTGLSEDQIRAL